MPARHPERRAGSAVAGSSRWRPERRAGPHGRAPPAPSMSTTNRTDPTRHEPRCQPERADDGRAIHDGCAGVQNARSAARGRAVWSVRFGSVGRPHAAERSRGRMGRATAANCKRRAFISSQVTATLKRCRSKPQRAKSEGSAAASLQGAHAGWYPLPRVRRRRSRRLHQPLTLAFARTRL